MRLGAVRPGEPLLVPVTAAAGVIGVLAISGARRTIDGQTLGVAQRFGSQAGAVLDRLRTVESLFDTATRDPVTGVGNRHQAAAIVAAMRPGDGLLLLEIDGFEQLRRARGDDAADLLLGQVGLHLRNGTRTGDAVARYGEHQFVVALRELKAPIDMVVGRLVDSWHATGPSRAMSVGGALHLDGDAPLDTVDRAAAALASAQRRCGGAAVPTWPRTSPGSPPDPHRTRKVPGRGARRKHPGPAHSPFRTAASPVKDTNRKIPQVSSPTGRKMDMIDIASPKATFRSRAVLRRVEAGTLVVCTHCDQPVKFAAKQQRQQVIANVYEDGKWVRVEHFHEECYPGAGMPYGEAADQGVSRSKVKA